MGVSWKWAAKSSILTGFSIINHPAIGVPHLRKPPYQSSPLPIYSTNLWLLKFDLFPRHCQVETWAAVEICRRQTSKSNWCWSKNAPKQLQHNSPNLSCLFSVEFSRSPLSQHLPDMKHHPKRKHSKWGLDVSQCLPGIFHRYVCLRNGSCGIGELRGPPLAWCKRGCTEHLPFFGCSSGISYENKPIISKNPGFWGSLSQVPIISTCFWPGPRQWQE